MAKSPVLGQNHKKKRLKEADLAQNEPNPDQIRGLRRRPFFPRKLKIARLIRSTSNAQYQ